MKIKNSNVNALIYSRSACARYCDCDDNPTTRQETRCKRYAQIKGYNIIGAFKDVGVSGNRTDRLGINSLIKFIVDNPDKKFVVVADDMARVARDFSGYLKLKTQIEDTGAEI